MREMRLAVLIAAWPALGAADDGGTDADAGVDVDCLSVPGFSDVGW